jgi:hypothetical protein
MKIFSLFLIVISLTFVSISAQSKRKSPRKKTVKVVAKPEAVIPPVETEKLPDAPHKKNERAAQTSQTELQKTNAGRTAKPTVAAPAPFVYEFSQPTFRVSRVLIEHDQSGKGKITFERQDLDGAISDPLTVSPAALERIKNLWDELKFLDSSENYQSTIRDYKHLGTMKFVRTDGERRRETEFNWTENPTAKSLSDEYKKLTEQFVWIFEINVARENQPLESPKLMDKIDRLIKQNQISDARQVLTFLREVGDDERLPLITRNHAARIIKSIEKQKK